MSKLTMEQVKSGRWIDADQVLVNNSIDVALNGVDDLLFERDIFVFNKLDNTSSIMNAQTKAILGKVLYMHAYMQEGSIKQELELLLGPEEFSITVGEKR